MQKLRILSQETRNSNTTIFFGHYPLSCTYSNGIQDVMRHGIVYLNGHLHASIEHMYARHSSGLLELELSDWKNNRRYKRYQDVVFKEIIALDSAYLRSMAVYYLSMIFSLENRSMQSYQIQKLQNFKRLESLCIG